MKSEKWKSKNPECFRIQDFWTPPAQFEPNDTVRSAGSAHNDGASAIAHNPRKRGDGGVAESTIGEKQKKE